MFYRKCERALKESVQAEQDAGHMVNELREMVERAQTKLKQTRKQLEEAVCVLCKMLGSIKSITSK